MKAIVMTATGGPQVLQSAEVEAPGLESPNQLLVRLKAAGVNPVDTKLRARGTYYPDRERPILGCDGAGVVEAVGPAVSRFKPGDEVYFCQGGLGGPPGTYAEYAVVDESCAAAKPASLNFAQAAAVPLVLITAWESLHDRARLAAGQRVLVHAGAGGVGHVAIQLARLAGCAVATTVTTADKAEFVRALGAELIIEGRDADFVGQTRAWTGGQGVDVALDTVGGPAFVESFGAVRFYGDLVTLLQPGPDTDWKEARLRNLRISLELMLSPMLYDLAEARRHQADILRQGAELIDAGRLSVHLAGSLPLEQAAEAHRLLESGAVSAGKLALVME